MKSKVPLAKFIRSSHGYDDWTMAEVLISTQGEAWTISRRYRDFSQLDKRFKWLDFKMPTPLPAKRWVNHATDEKFLEEVGDQVWRFDPSWVRREGESAVLRQGGAMGVWLAHVVMGLCLMQRRAGLEAYLVEAVAAANESPTVLGKPLMSFLDDDCLKIGMPDRFCKDQNEEETEEEKERESFDQLSKAVGGFVYM